MEGCCCEVTSVVSDSVWPLRQQPTRLPCPWDSPGKITGVGCHFLLQCMKVKMKVKSLSRVRLLVTHGLQPTRLLRPWDFPGKSTGVGCHCLLQFMDGGSSFHFDAHGAINTGYNIVLWREINGHMTFTRWHNITWRMTSSLSQIKQQKMSTGILR